jgi:dihydroorotase
MHRPHPADELATLRDLLERMETGALTMNRPGHGDVTKHEMDILRLEIAHLEKVLIRLKGGEAP